MEELLNGYLDYEELACCATFALGKEDRNAYIRKYFVPKDPNAKEVKRFFELWKESEEEVLNELMKVYEEDLTLAEYVLIHYNPPRLECSYSEMKDLYLRIIERIESEKAKIGLPLSFATIVLRDDILEKGEDFVKFYLEDFCSLSNPERE